jgi:hypothetical protein
VDTEMEFKGHIGWTVFNADTFYIHNEYSSPRKTKNDYGTGVNMKLIFALQNQRWGTFEMKAFIYEVFNIFRNENKAFGSDLCMSMTTDYSYPIGKQTSIGIAASVLWHMGYYDTSPDTQKWTNDAKLHIAWNM